MKPIHPFPARMAPEIALDALSDLPKGAKVLDPMTGSGTVLREALLRGHTGFGYDLDPLAVLISKVWTYPVNLDTLEDTFERLLKDAKKTKTASLPWMDKDQETLNFVDFWFCEPQKSDLRALAHVLYRYQKRGEDQHILDALKVALSRIIITKKVGASLAWDISHSRPHRKRIKNDYDVFSGYEKSVKRLIKQLSFEKDFGKAKITRGDARNLKGIKAGSIDAVVTSPPYLNAIDYMRGHKFALIWFGHTISELRAVRSISVGAEKIYKSDDKAQKIIKIRKKVLADDALPPNKVKMIERYVGDSLDLMSEIARVLAKKGKAVLVVGNSCLKGVYIQNSKVFEHAGKQFGLKLISAKERELPASSRYLPIPKGAKEPLGKRMRSEIVLTFQKQ